jgi:hypothetical protein
MSGFKHLLLAALFASVLATTARPQQRPLLTEDVDVIKPGVIRIETSFDFLQDQRFPLSGLRGDMVSIANTRLSFGLAQNVEFQVEWTPRNFLTIKSQQPSLVPLKLGSSKSSTSDFGDATLWMKMKLRGESSRAPSLGFRFGVQLPNSNQARGIGTNTTNFYATVNAGKRLMSEKLNLFGNIGLGILQAPLSTFSQNDVLLYGLAGIYKLSDQVNLLGEVNGLHSTRKHAPAGTEDFSEVRLGTQVRALGLRWNVAGIFGLSERAPKTGLSIGITFDWKAFTPTK